MSEAFEAVLLDTAYSIPLAEDWCGTTVMPGLSTVSYSANVPVAKLPVGL